MTGADGIRGRHCLWIGHVSECQSQTLSVDRTRVRMPEADIVCGSDTCPNARGRHCLWIGHVSECQRQTLSVDRTRVRMPEADIVCGSDTCPNAKGGETKLWCTLAAAKLMSTKIVNLVPDF